MGGNATLSNVNAVQLADTGAGGRTFTLNGWSGTGSIAFDPTDTLVAIGSGNMSLTSTNLTGDGFGNMSLIYVFDNADFGADVQHSASCH